MSDVVLVGILGVIGVLITSGATITVAILRNNSNKLDQIHYLVNDRLDKALGEIESLKQILADAGIEHPKRRVSDGDKGV